MDDASSYHDTEDESVKQILGGLPDIHSKLLDHNLSDPDYVISFKRVVIEILINLRLLQDRLLQQLYSAHFGNN